MASSRDVFYSHAIQPEPRPFHPKSAPVAYEADGWPSFSRYMSYEDPDVIQQAVTHALKYLQAPLASAKAVSAKFHVATAALVLGESSAMNPEHLDTDAFQLTLPHAQLISQAYADLLRDRSTGYKAMLQDPAVVKAICKLLQHPTVSVRTQLAAALPDTCVYLDAPRYCVSAGLVPQLLAIAETDACPAVVHPVLQTLAACVDARGGAGVAALVDAGGVSKLAQLFTRTAKTEPDTVAAGVMTTLGALAAKPGQAEGVLATGIIPGAIELLQGTGTKITTHIAAAKLLRAVAVLDDGKFAVTPIDWAGIVRQLQVAMVADMPECGTPVAELCLQLMSLCGEACTHPEVNAALKAGGGVKLLAQVVAKDCPVFSDAAAAAHARLTWMP